MLKIEFHPEAEVEFEAAYRWYTKRSRSAADRFLEGVEIATKQVCQLPEQWPTYLHGTRYFRVTRYPYAVVYLRLPDRIFAVAVAHLKRRPGYWKNRLD
ncbi:type II toxin-antitoxin system RelE/ParE family toxin [Botrimarina sp.]|uniref:type II toxin-antitoxin system RelE/ParE family toxin n=1 Tax=Botrimarina sp. TaxID=2795802 RepID=UPI0032EF99AB